MALSRAAARATDRLAQQTIAHQDGVATTRQLQDVGSEPVDGGATRRQPASGSSCSAASCLLHSGAITWHESARGALLYAGEGAAALTPVGGVPARDRRAPGSASSSASRIVASSPRSRGSTVHRRHGAALARAAGCERSGVDETVLDLVRELRSEDEVVALGVRRRAPGCAPRPRAAAGGRGVTGCDIVGSWSASSATRTAGSSRRWSTGTNATSTDATGCRVARTQVRAPGRRSVDPRRPGVRGPRRARRARRAARPPDRSHRRGHVAGQRRGHRALRADSPLPLAARRGRSRVRQLRRSRPRCARTAGRVDCDRAADSARRRTA